MPQQEPTCTYRPGPIEHVPEEVEACFPPEGLVHQYVWWASQCTYIHPILHVACCLPLLCFEATRRQFDMDWGQADRESDQRCRPSLQILLVGRSGVGKSTALGLAKRFHHAYLAESLGEAWRPDIDPLVDPWVAAYGTVSGVLVGLARRFDKEVNATNVVLHNDELSSLLGDPVMATTLLKLFDGDTFSRQLRGMQEAEEAGQAAHHTVRNPSASGIFCSTEEALMPVVTAQTWEGGFASRLLWFSGEGDIDRMTLEMPRKEAELRLVAEAWAHLGGHLSGLALGGKKVVDVPVDVQQLLEDSLFEAYREHQRRRGSGRMTPIRFRGVQRALLVSRLYAMSCGRLTVSAEDMVRAINLIEYSYRCVEPLSQRLGVDRGWRHQGVVLEAIRAAGDLGLKKSDLYPRVRLPRAELDEALQGLVEREEITVTQEPTGGRGRPRLRYRVASTNVQENAPVAQLSEARSIAAEDN